MFGYRHTFHAGNFADVFKHALLVQLVLALRRKDKPFCVIDTHAGAGQYELESASALKNREFADGIGRIWNAEDAPLGEEVSAYLDLVRTMNPDGILRWYPGSPRIARTLLRPDDRLILCERHPTDHSALRGAFDGDRQVVIHFRDGYEAPKALIPPPQRRGLVLMDPSFEMPGEFARLTTALTTIHQRWAGATVAIWYPIIARESSREFLDHLGRLGIPAILCAELGIAPYHGPRGMHGCGMVIVNPPWNLPGMLKRLLPELLARLRTSTQGETRLRWLTPAT